MVPADSGGEQPSAAVPRLDPDSAGWLQMLAGTGPAREAALAQLHEMLVRIARGEVGRRAPRLQLTGPELDDLAHQAAADALIAITGKLGQFRGESRFTTWAYKFVIFEVSAKLGRHYWRNPPAQAGDDAWERIPDRFGADPAQHAESRELAGALRRAVTEVLSDRQRRVFVAIIVEGVPLDSLAAELGSTRNALYKTMFDARRKIRAHLVAHGYLDNEEPGMS